jgi:hypothetical protein
MSEERKTLEQRPRMTDAERRANSTAHVVAMATACHPEPSEGSLKQTLSHTSHD